MTRDPEGYSPFLVKQLLSASTDPLSLLFSSFLSTGKIPSAWKRAVIPVFKKALHRILPTTDLQVCVNADDFFEFRVSNTRGHSYN